MNVKDYSEFNTNDDYSAGLTKLNTEIMSGVIPDMFLTENLPIERYAAKGILTDLYELIDSDAELTRESFVPQIIQACETDGKLYELPASFMVQTAFGLSKVVDGYDVWNVAAVQDAMTSCKEDAYAVFTITPRRPLSWTVSPTTSPGFVNWQTGECSFDSESFITLLNFASSSRRNRLGRLTTVSTAASMSMMRR